MRLREWVYGVGVLWMGGILLACGNDDGAATNTANQGEGIAVAEATDNALATTFARHAAAQTMPTSTVFVVGDDGTVTVLSPDSQPITTPTDIVVLPSALPSNTPTEPSLPPTPVSTNTPTIAPTEVAYASINALNGEHYWLAHPFYPDGGYVAAVSYLYGVRTPDGRLQPHHGLDFQAQHGTVVNAAGSGRVLFAGDDFERRIFGPQVNFYGNTVVIEHFIPIPDTGELYKVYTLYGHLSTIYVEEGSKVQQFDPIGEVGMTGVAQGPHLHFEIRIGDAYDYGSTYNPALWLTPRNGYGVLAGQVRDADGELIADAEIRITDTSTLAVIYTGTYTSDSGANSNPWHRENFAVPQLLVGHTYEVIINRWGKQLARREITILPDQTTMMYVSVQ